ncbi:hypothetical protein [Novosphingobium sp. AAP83]|uniref:hypothetical protein n=1 Tax=Novosphingobium sp. AAP83 TaxID=1523425 RepID=UPI0018D05A0D|nr:hypothetical protein [Novosphingobium sp. AAP83]
MLRSANPPAFPTGLIVPPPRGAMITAVPWPEIAAPATGVCTRPTPSSKIAAGKAKAAKPKSGRGKKGARMALKPGPHRHPIATLPPVTAGATLAKDKPAAMLTHDLLDRALAMRPMPIAEVPVPAPPPRAPVTAVADKPIARGQALAPVRGQGLFDIIGHWLRDAGNWLIRLDKSRRKDEERARIAQAKARHHALQSQFDALEALREAGRAD